MKIAQNVAEVLGEHLVLEVEGIDRMYLNVCVPQLQWACGIVPFFPDTSATDVGLLGVNEPYDASLSEPVEAIHRGRGDRAGAVSQRTTKRRCDGRAAEEVHRGGRDRLHRQGPGETRGVPDSETPQSAERPELSLDRVRLARTAIKAQVSLQVVLQM